jgi:hypothetical protein
VRQIGAEDRAQACICEELLLRNEGALTKAVVAAPHSARGISGSGPSDFASHALRFSSHAYQSSP